MVKKFTESFVSTSDSQNECCRSEKCTPENINNVMPPNPGVNNFFRKLLTVCIHGDGSALKNTPFKPMDLDCTIGNCVF